MTDTKVTHPLHLELADGLRKVADFVEANPEYASWLRYGLQESGIDAHPEGDDKAAALGAFARATLRAGAKVEKEFSDQFAFVNASFGAVKVSAYDYRSKVCELVELDEEETVEVDDPEWVAPEAPKVTVTRKKTEWQCAPLLAAEQPAAVSS